MLRKSLLLVVVLFSAASFALAEAIVVPPPSSSPPAGLLERLAQRIEPELAGQPERVQQYVDFFRSEIGNDHRLFGFQVAAQAVTTPGFARSERPTVRLRGHIQFPESRASLVKFLEILGFDVEDQLESLPAESLGQHIFGFVKTTNSLSYDQPSGRQTVETDCLLGEPLYLLREEDGHLLVHSGEGYLGYVRAADVVRVDAEEFARYTEGPFVRVTADHQIDSGLRIPAGARLKWVASEADRVAAELPTGERVDLPRSACEVRDEPAAELDAIIASAKQLLGTPYLWGGKTSQGVDCSGLVQVSFATAGLNLPRDSWQQFYVGQLTATRWHTAGLRRGDTLYFLGADGRIRHTGIYLGDDRFLHAVSPVATINSFNPEHDDYAPRQHESFAFAKRLLD